MRYGWAAIVGAGAFGVAQAWLFAWQAPAGLAVDDPGWFLNSGANMKTIVAVIATASLAWGLLVRMNPIPTAVAIAAGASLVMVGVLFAVGPGNLFPIVIAIGAGLLFAASGAGTFAGYGARRLMGRG